MPGSQTKIEQVLVYNNRTDKAEWVIPSYARVLEASSPEWEFIDQTDANYESVKALAGPMPELYHQEVVQLNKESTSDQATN